MSARGFPATLPYPLKQPDGSNWPDGTILWYQDDGTLHFWNAPTNQWVALLRGTW